MSVRLKTSSLNKEQLQIIKNMLVIEEKKKYIPCKNPFIRKMMESEKEYVIMFNISSNGEYINLPYAFACRLLKERQNMSKKFREVNFEFTGELRPEQKELVKNSVEKFLETGTVLLAADTGTGKSVMSAYFSSLTHVPVLVMFKLGILPRQWVTTYLKNTNAKVFVWYEGKPYFSYNSNVDGKFILPDVYIIMCTQLSKLPEYMINDIGCTIIDEIHQVCTPSKVEILLKTEPRFVIGCSATPFRKDNLHLMGQSILGIHIQYLKNLKPVKVYKILTGIEPEYVLNKLGNVDFGKIVHSLYENDKRNQLIVNLIKENYTNYKILVAFYRRVYNKQMSDFLNSIGIPSDYMMGGKKTYTEQRVLCGVAQKMGAAFDEETGCENFSGERLDLLILTFTMKDQDALTQLVGRVRRSDIASVFDLVDNSPIHTKHWMEREKYYKSINAEITTIDLSPPKADDSMSSVIEFTKNMLLHEK